MKLAISGASSFIGIELIKKAILLNWEVIAIVREKSDKSRYLSSLPNIKIFECNMENYSCLGTVIGPVDCFVHLSWNGTRGESRFNESLQEKNYECAMAAIKSMIIAGCKRIITAGSQAEYGFHSGLITEDTCCNPNSAYGKYKLRLFNEASEYCKANHVDFIEPRYFSLFGPNDYEETMIISTLKRMLKNEPCEFTESVQMWDYLYIDDAIDALVLLCQADIDDGAYNIASGDCRELKSFINEMKKITNSKSELLYGAIPYGQSGMVSIHPSIGKMKRETGWIVKNSFGLGISKVIVSMNNKNIEGVDSEKI